VVRLLPEAQRAEIDAELNELIAETIGARAGSDSDLESNDVERAVLAELGDPSAMAARYRDRPRALVGADVFPEYLRVLRLVLAVAVPIVTGLAVLGAVLGDGADAGDVVGAAIGAAFNSAIQVAFWVTLVYAFADRWKADDPWTPDRLPDLPAGNRGAPVGRGETLFGIVVTVLAGVALVWQHVWPPLENVVGEGVPFLHPDIWDGAGQGLLALLAVSVVVQVAVFTGRRWTYRLATANAIVNLASLAIAVWLAANERFVNPEFLTIVADKAEWDFSLDNTAWALVGVIALVEIWDTAEAFVRAHRSATTSRTETVH